ncbi:MAG: hypothetical protein Q9162_002190 [Coniocarpon cinnabarinum]
MFSSSNTNLPTGYVHYNGVNHWASMLPGADTSAIAHLQKANADAKAFAQMEYHADLEQKKLEIVGSKGPSNEQSSHAETSNLKDGDVQAVADDSKEASAESVARPSAESLAVAKDPESVKKTGAKKTGKGEWGSGAQNTSAKW